MFVPNNTCSLYGATTTMDIRGERTYLPVRLGVPCAVISFNLKIDKTSVRADSSGSRGRAEEDQGDAMLLFPPSVEIYRNDIVACDGQILEAVSIMPRRSVLGMLDHYEIIFRRSELPS